MAITAISRFVNTLHKSALAIVVLGVTLIGSWSANAQNLPDGPVVEARLVSENLEVTPGETTWIALDLDILKHWHVYWRNAGDAGTPPAIKWDLPGGVSIGEINWPVPERLAEGPLMTYAYENELLLPMQLTVDKSLAPGETLVLKGRARWLVCHEICIPESADVELPVFLASEAKPDTLWQPKISEALTHLPKPAPWTVGLFGGDSSLSLQVQDPAMGAALSANKSASVVFFPYEENIISNPAEQKLARSKNGFTLTVDLQRGAVLPESISGILVFEEELNGENVERSFEFTAEAGTAAALSAAGSAEAGISLWGAALLAFLGGIILNIMPCVFPVLFMKALGFMNASDSSHGAIRKQGIFYTLGVIASFLSLAVVLIALRASGAEIGWGFQLQSPVVIGLLSVLMLAIALSLSGVYEIEGRFMNMGSGLASKEGGLGSFFTGVLATVVATPCTAPFMGAALGFALTQSSATSLTIFFFLGLGMASPYLLLSFVPSLVKKLPKPGLWMDRAKQFLAFPMYGTAAWLVWVFGQQVTPDVFMVLLGTLVVFAFSLWALGAAQGASGRWSLIGHAIGILGIVATLVSVAGFKGEGLTAGSAPAAGNEGSLAYSTFSPEKLAELRGEDKPVFVNFTAAWCISCLVNERVVFTEQNIADAFEDKGVTYLKADWTNRDPVITRTLAQYGRAGVPLYLYFAPGADAPVILPQILTEQIVLDAIGAN